jgi:hypothetical protein
VSSSVYVIPNKLPVNSRLWMQLLFDLPRAVGAFDDNNAWAVGLHVKKDATMDAPKQPEVVVTCQFRTADGHSGVGVRLNTPGALQQDGMRTATNVATAPDYEQWAHDRQGRLPTFALEFLFCGAGAQALGHAVGYGSLSIAGQSDQRVLSHANLWPIEITPAGHGPWIGALGASVVIAAPMGGNPPLPGDHVVRARFLAFSIALWPQIESSTPPTNA